MEQNDIYSYQIRFLGFKYSRNAFAAKTWPQIHYGVFGAQGKCLMTANVVLFLLNEI